jgi:hypothetical protein
MLKKLMKFIQNFLHRNHPAMDAIIALIKFCIKDIMSLWDGCNNGAHPKIVGMWHFSRLY